MHISTNPRGRAISLLLGCGLVLSGCLAMYEIAAFEPTEPRRLSSGAFTVTIDSELQPSTDMGYRELLMVVRVTNTSGSEAVFDSRDLSVFVPESGLSYYSIARGQESVSLPQHRSDVITAVPIGAGETIKGRLWFTAGRGDMDVESFMLRYGDAELEFLRD